jgi:hypothetical protein
MIAIKTFEEAANHLGINPTNRPGAIGLPFQYAKKMLAHYQLMVIHAAITSDHKAQFADMHLDYSLIFEVVKKPNGTLALKKEVFVNYMVDGTEATVFVFPTRESAEYMAENFLPLFEEYIL